MKTIILSITLAFSAYFMHAQSNSESPTTGTTITVTVPVQTNDGEILFGLYNEATFMKSAPLTGLKSAIAEGTATVTFTNIEPGTYAITLFHDKNGNQQMDFEPNGMPKENYGVSNNIMSYGPPQWSDAKFEVSNEPLTMEIRM